MLRAGRRLCIVVHKGSSLLCKPWATSKNRLSPLPPDRVRRTNFLEVSVSVPLSLTINGKPVSTQVDPRLLLVQLIREQLLLTGTHVGCDTAQCGACTVHLNGRAVKACSMLAVQAQGAEITTIEGPAQNGTLHPMQAAFRECHGLQCGFCTPGMVMSAVALLADKPGASEQEIREGLEGNICRCTGYHNIVKSIQLCQSGKVGAAA